MHYAVISMLSKTCTVSREFPRDLVIFHSASKWKKHVLSRHVTMTTGYTWRLWYVTTGTWYMSPWQHITGARQIPDAYILLLSHSIGRCIIDISPWESNNCPMFTYHAVHRTADSHRSVPRHLTGVQTSPLTLNLVADTVGDPRQMGRHQGHFIKALNRDWDLFVSRSCSRINTRSRRLTRFIRGRNGPWFTGEK